MQRADFLIVGGGVAGLSAAAQLAGHGKVILLEAEESLGYHSSGRSATFSHYGIGNRTVRALTACSRDHLLEPGDPPLSRRSAALFVATEAMHPALRALHSSMAEFTHGLREIEGDELHRLFPPLRLGPADIVAGLIDPDGLRLDSHAMLQSYARNVREAGGMVATGQRVIEVGRAQGDWQVRTATGEKWAAPILINAAGAWADSIGTMAGAVPLGLRPLRRTIIVVDPPAGADARDWPFVKTVVDDFYILPESGRLMASPVDEVESVPGDSQPEEYDVALAAAKVEQYTTLKVDRIAHRWSGLRTFTADRVPVSGFATDTPGFYWLAGQGGYGLQTAPAMAETVASLILGRPWPATLARRGVEPRHLGPERLFKHSSQSTET